jgi:hypothetical protein
MAKFIKLLDWKTDADVEINPEHIQMMRSPASDSVHQTIIYLAGIKPLEVKQTVDEIKELIRQSDQRQSP